MLPPSRSSDNQASSISSLYSLAPLKPPLIRRWTTNKSRRNSPTSAASSAPTFFVSFCPYFVVVISQNGWHTADMLYVYGGITYCILRLCSIWSKSVWSHWSTGGLAMGQYAECCPVCYAWVAIEPAWTRECCSCPATAAAANVATLLFRDLPETPVTTSPASYHWSPPPQPKTGNAIQIRMLDMDSL